MAINLSQSDVATKVGLKKFDNLNLNSLFFENVMNIEIDGVKQLSENFSDPLMAWNRNVSQLTSVPLENELRAAYLSLIKITNEHDLGGALNMDPARFPQF